MGFKLQAKKFYCILLKGQIQTALFLTSKNCKKGDQIQIFSLPFTLHNRDIRLFSICHVLCSRKLELRVWRKMKNSLQQKSWYVNSSEMIKIWPYWTHNVQSIVGFNRYNLFQWFKTFRSVTSSEVFHQIFFHQWINDVWIKMYQHMVHEYIKHFSFFICPARLQATDL